MKKVVKKLTVIFVVVLIIGGGAFGYEYFNRKKKPTYDFIVAKKETLIQEVSVTGRVKSAESVDLAFEKNGKVAKVNAAVGNKVVASQILIELNNAELKAQLLQAKAGIDGALAQKNQYQAALETQQAKLEEIKKGTRPEEIKMAETKVVNTEKALINAQSNLEKTLKKANSELSKAQQVKTDAQTNLTNITNKANTELANLYKDAKNILNGAFSMADDAVNTKTSEMFTGDTSDNPQLNFSTYNPQNKSKAESARQSAGAMLKRLKEKINNLTTDYPVLDAALENAEEYLSSIRDSLAVINEAVNDARGVAATTVSTYQTNISTGRTNINTALSNVIDQQTSIAVQKQTNTNNIDAAQSELNASQATLTLQEATNQSNVSNAQTNLTTAQNTQASAEDELALKKAGSTPEQITAQEALVKQARANISSQDAKIKEAEANYQNYQAQFEKTLIRSPIDGIITKFEAKVGEIVSANANIISLISINQFEVDAFIPEADIAKVKIGDVAKTTLDAYGSDVVFETKVIKIEPAETMIEGVATYKTTLQFTQNNERIKSGMTANLDILTNKKENVIAIPGRAIISSNGNKVARLLQGKKLVDVNITTGVRGSDGRVEILSGINEGDKVITFMEE